MKANSSRVRGKNFRDFCGKPLFKWILDTLQEVEEIDQIIINTDARDLLLEKGLKESPRLIIRDRSADICGDTVSMNLIISDDLNNSDADIYVMTHTTNPILSSKTIANAIMAYKKGKKADKSDSLFTVNKHQTRFYKKNGSPINHDPDNLIPTQDLEEWYEENSCLYIFSKEGFALSKARIGNKPILFETPKLESIDIDTQDDWDLARAICSSL